VYSTIAPQQSEKMPNISDPKRDLHRLLDDSEKPSLGSLPVVSRLVRDFVKRALDTRAAWHRGEPGATDPVSVLLEEARKMGNVFMGRDAAYDAQPWNSPRRLGYVIDALLPEETKHYGDPGAAMFMWLATQAIAAGAAIEQGQSETAARQRLNAIVHDVTQRLLGAKY